MIYSKTGTLKDTYIFSMANSLAMAIIDAPKVIMRFANIKCLKLIEQKDRLIAKAEIYKNVDKKHYVKVVINNKAQEQIFRGKFIFEELELGGECMRIVIDGMGGDNAPESNVEGAVNAIKEYGIRINYYRR